MNEETSILIIYISVGLALIWSVINAYMVTGIKLETSESSDGQFNNSPYDNEKNNLIDSDKVATIKSIGDKISAGANAFLF